MIKFFKNKRKEFLKKDKLVNYLKYAFGEIILVVVGILIAVSINNWNEDRKQKKNINNILAIVAEDIKNDTIEANKILKSYNDKKAYFLKIMNDGYTKEEFMDCKSCPYLITNSYPFTINKRGYDLLNEYADYSEANQDSLVFQINNFYTTSIQNVNRIHNFIDDDIRSNMKEWSDKYPWFLKLFNGEIDKNSYDYFYADPIYKNKVVYHYALIYRSFIPVLEGFNEKSKVLLEKIDGRLK
ncbi:MULTISPECIES: DUF6090 family protein [Galbibacter]|uniref:DUF6090 family protein n=1 Tax=Galbibacter pacificus TaxID=2996052 RepID=A0ABT6FQI5_9FLAO|nr:DUF6090 family protein [Galbibacter pacificus]MDG3581996.1 DUF6090 family protein [Galbibacter pacificus]MDG3585530.1 DUF6090 family protein [Galbibacter pacificus]